MIIFEKMTRRTYIQSLITLGLSSFMSKSVPKEVQFPENHQHIIGLGLAGSETIKYIFQRKILGEFTYVANEKISACPENINFIYCFSPIITRVDKDMSNQEVVNQIKVNDKILSLVESDKKIILFSGLGGCLGTSLTLKLGELLYRKGKNFQIFTSFPFSFEGRRKRSLAQYAVEQLSYYDNFHCHNFDDTIKGKGKGNLLMSRAFEIGREKQFEMYLAANEKQT
ncbi:MAG: hypothetical protein SFU27_09895 [Thermonemataceae bacterium]|nr:hypothetical protein [Thermonemataceae bacterium]